MVQYAQSTAEWLHVCTGKKEMEREILALEDQFPDSARGVAEFSTPLAHQIIAGDKHTHVSAINSPVCCLYSTGPV